MRDLEQREKRVNNVQMTGDKMLKEGHPARKTVEVLHFTINNLLFIVCPKQTTRVNESYKLIVLYTRVK